MKFVKKIVTLLNRELPTSTLIKRGMKVGCNFNRQQGCFIDPTHCFLISIGDNVTMSIRVTLMAHDASTKHTLNYTKIGQINIGNNVFIGANSTILPGVTIGDGAIIGAGSIVTHDIPPQTVVAGVPARVLCTLEDYMTKNFATISDSNTFDESYRLGCGLNETKKQELRNATQSSIAFIK